jgi:hypothetical protein
MKHILAQLLSQRTSQQEQQPNLDMDAYPN